MKTLEERKVILEMLPWVKKLKESTKCDAIRSGAPLKMYWKMPGKRGEMTQEQREAWFCKRPAWYHFTSLKKSYAKDGNYCWMHLMDRGLFYDNNEIDRTFKYLDKKGVE